MTTAYDAIAALAQILGDLVDGTTTAAGSTTTTVDTARTEADDYWNGGTVFKPATSQTRVVSDFANTSGTITHAAFPAAVGSAASYRVFSKEFPRRILLQSVSRALGEMALPEYDTSLTVVADQREYSLPAAVTDVLTLDIATSASEPYGYMAYFSGWKVVDGKLQWDAGTQPQDAGKIIRLGYHAVQAAVTDDSGAIDSRISLERLAWQAAVHAWRWRIQHDKGQDAFHLQLLNEASQRADLLARKHPLPRFQRSARLPL